MGRILSVIVGTVLLAGCALPMPVQIASWALDGISFITTEKSLTDHGISMVAQKDCALWRGLKGNEVCSDIDDAGIFAIAAAEKTEIEEDIAALADFDTAAGSPEVAPAEIAKPQPQSDNGERLMISGKRVWSDRIDADLYYVIGSFSERDNARRMVKKHRDLGPAVMASRLDGIEIYRVAVGPFVGEQKRAMRIQLKQAGVKNAWAMRVDHRDWMLASPTELNGPVKAVAEVPSPPVKQVEKPISPDELAETPDDIVDPNQTSELIEGDKRYIVIGSFSNPDNARNFAKNKADFQPRIMSAETAEGWRHRVVLGPYAEVEGIEVRRRLARAGIERVWALHLNPDDILSDTLLAENTDGMDQIENSAGEEIAEIPETHTPATEVEAQDDASSDEMSWGVNLVKNIIDMFRSTDSTDVVGIVSALES